MRNLVLAGAVVMAISALSSGAYAGGSHGGGGYGGGGALKSGEKLLGGCLIVGALATVQTNCGFNIIAGSGHKSSDDYNTQSITQKNKGELKESRGPVKVEAVSRSNGGYGGKLLQLNGGLNVVENGDDNTQSIDQKNFYKGPEPKHDSVVQLNVGINTVSNGSDNTQSIEQSNSLSYSSGHK